MVLCRDHRIRVGRIVIFRTGFGVGIELVGSKVRITMTGIPVEGVVVRRGGNDLVGGIGAVSGLVARVAIGVWSRVPRV